MKSSSLLLSAKSSWFYFSPKRYRINSVRYVDLILNRRWMIVIASHLPILVFGRSKALPAIDDGGPIIISFGSIMIRATQGGFYSILRPYGKGKMSPFFRISNSFIYNICFGTSFLPFQFLLNCPNDGNHVQEFLSALFGRDNQTSWDWFRVLPFPGALRNAPVWALVIESALRRMEHAMDES